MAVVLLSMVALGFLSIDLFSRNSVLTAERQAKVQNSIAFAMSHMTKSVADAIGDKNNPPITFPTTTPAGDAAIIIRVDGNNNGMRDVPGDKEVAYAYNASAYSFRYYDDYTNDTATYEELSNKVVSGLNTTYVSVSDFTTCTNCTNYIGIKLVGRWRPEQNASQQNPEVTLYTYTKMPLVSTN
jgi:hypothetical protein